MGKVKDLKGQQFGDLLVMEFSHKDEKHSNRSMWKVRCKCGKEMIVAGNLLTTGNTKSCGCSKSYIDITGQRFGRLLVLGLSHRKQFKKNNVIYWECVCDCGTVKKITRSGLVSRDYVSCGCYNKEKQTKHGMEGTRFYKTWRGMIERCNNKKRDSYNNYGGRGITVCNRWLDFKNFYDDMYSNYNDGLQIDRIDTNGDYDVNNCRWVTPKENSNNRTNNRYIEIDGVTKTLRQWCDEYNSNYFNVWALINRGWEPKKALKKHSKI